MFILESSITQKTHAKIIERKYSHLVLSTIAHDFKTPISTVQANLDLLNAHVSEQGSSHLNIAQTTLEAFKYYIYDLIVTLLYHF